MQRLLGRGVRILVQRFHHALRAEHLFRVVHGLGQAVGVDEQLVAPVQLQFILSVAGPRHAADDEAVDVPEHLEVPSLAADGRVLVAGAGAGHLAGGDLQYAQPHRHEHLRLIVGADGLVRLREDLAGAAAQHGAALQDHLADHHEQRRRHALAADIRDHHAQVVVVDQKVIVEVSPHFPGGVHAGVQVEFRPIGVGREHMGHHAGLDQVRHAQLRADALLFRRDAGDVVDVLPGLLRKVVEGQGQQLDLVVRAVAVLHVEQLSGIAAVGDVPGHLFNGPGHPPRRHEGRRHAQGDDSQQQHISHPLAAGGARRELLAGPGVDLVVGGQHPLLRLLGPLLVHGHDRRPAHRGHGGAGDVVFPAIKGNDLQVGGAGKGLLCQGGDLGKARVPLRLCLLRGGENALFLRGEQHLPLPVHDEGSDSAFGGGLHEVVDAAQHDVDARHPHQHPVRLHGNGTGDRQRGAEHIPDDAGEVEAVRLHGPPIPGALAHREGDGPARFVQFAQGLVVHAQVGAVLQADVQAVDLLRALVHGDHGGAQVPQYAQQLRSRRVDPLLAQGVGRRRAIHGGLRAADGNGLHRLRVLQQRLGHVLQRVEVVDHLGKIGVGHGRLQGDRVHQRPLLHLQHRLLRDAGDRLLLLLPRLFHKGLQYVVLIDGDPRKQQRHDHQHQQHEAQDPLLQPSESYAQHFFHRSHSPGDKSIYRPAARSVKPGSPARMNWGDPSAFHLVSIRCTPCSGRPRPQSAPGAAARRPSGGSGCLPPPCSGTAGCPG